MGFWKTVLALGLFGGSAACTNGARCDASHPCYSSDECVDGLCVAASGNDGDAGTGGAGDNEFCGGGRLVGADRCEYDTPLCDVYCTLACTQGPATGTWNPGDCPEGFTDCRQGNHGDTYMCKSNGLQSWQLACSSDADCDGVILVVSR